MDLAGCIYQEIKDIDNDRRVMLKAYQEKPTFKAAVDKCRYVWKTLNLDGCTADLGYHHFNHYVAV